MAERGNGGAIVNISSIAAIRTTAYHTSYSTSKAALDMMTSSMAHELGCKKVKLYGNQKCTNIVKQVYLNIELYLN
jgi:NAD(P)-dependent dehydrogenase (short-subunit alcohol dehydrogenase family)